MHEYLRAVDVVAELRVHPTTLRRYEERGLVKPMRDHNGIRYYTCEQVEYLRKLIEPHRITSKTHRTSGTSSTYDLPLKKNV